MNLQKTTAHRRYVDDVPEEVKLRRLKEMTNLFYTKSQALKREKIGQQQLVLVEGVSSNAHVILKQMLWKHFMVLLILNLSCRIAREVQI